MKTSKRLILGVTASILLAGSFFITGCGSKTNPTSANPGPSGTPVYSTSAVTVVNGGGSFYPSGIGFYNSSFWIINGINSDLFEYSSSGTLETTISTFNGTGSFHYPVGVNVGPDGTVYVGDWGNNQVEVFSSSGSYQTTITGLTSVVGAAVNSAGTTLYVVEQTPALLTYSITGSTTKTFAPIGSFNTSSGAGILEAPQFITLDTSNNIYVTNDMGYIVKYDPADSNPVSFSSTTLSLPEGIVVDSAGNVLVASHNTPGFIQEFNPSGSTYTGGVTFGNSYINAPMGLALDSSGNLYAANCNGNQILEFKNTN